MGYTPKIYRVADMLKGVEYDNNFKDDDVYFWSTPRGDGYGTVKDMVETCGLYDKYEFMCKYCNVKTLKMGVSIVNTGLLCKDCAKTSYYVNTWSKVFPFFDKMYDSEKNTVPLERLRRSDNKNDYWFVCEKGHSFTSKIRGVLNSTTGFHGCPVCSGRSLVEGNSLYDVFGDMVDGYWDYGKNDSNGLKPDMIAPHSNVRAFWRCINCGKTYEQPICNRVVSVGYCPDCVSKMYQSSGEAELADWLSRYVDVVERYKFAGRGTELDIYIPSKHIGIEFNGIYYHSDAILTDKNSDYKKYKKAEERGITFMCVSGRTTGSTRKTW